ncbi:flavoprotein oxygenase [Cryptococcus wingfieldii CBS 7118]|uniref:Flavoprotein oxygenase n=1 Tax=Cryptococcus wingfieldii CBS 7118 TaxID=1295528 RepID=A0A1E3K559_9TREE|nr:flavoprotein oxygenase [Cryptococcus wingfieldii CBS 7118]ODO07382.1 flavoprotein oxygenase [Cryptococcus wingfieldii CBS 7118]
MTKHQPFKEVEATRPDFHSDVDPSFTKTPNPDFKPGQGLNNLPSAGDFSPTEKGWKSIIPENEAGADVYKMMISAITPRPIAFVSSLGDDGKANLAPISYFNAVSHDPPTIMISIAAGQRSDGLKDTSHNIKDTKEFCVSIISEPFIEAANYTSIDAPPEVDEWALSGLTQRSSETVSPPHVAESAFSMECEVSHWHDLVGSQGKTTSSVILGRIKRFQVREFVVDPEDPMKIRTEQLRPVSRLGGISYSRSTQILELPRPVWKQVQDTPEVKEALEQGAKKQGAPAK